MTTVKSWAILGLFVLSAGCGARSTNNNVGNGSNTNWLQGCDSTSDCDGICASGACTKTCGDDDDCTGLGQDARCGDAVPVVTIGTDSCPDTEPRRVCAPSCDEASDCTSIGEGYVCQSGACVPGTCVVDAPCEGDDCLGGASSCDSGNCLGSSPTSTGSTTSTNGPSCEEYAPAQCSEHDCTVIAGRPRNGCTTGASSAVGCTAQGDQDDAEACAINPDDGVCYLFPTTTTPNGWESVSCQDAPCALEPCAVDDCFSPFQNAEQAYDEGAVGCDCDDENAGACIGGAAIMCMDGKWEAVEDGPCYPTEQPCEGFIEGIATCLELFNTCKEEAGRFCGLNRKTEQCDDGIIVQTEDECLDEAANCTQLDNGLWCTAPATSLCQENFNLSEGCGEFPSYGCSPLSETAGCMLQTRSVTWCQQQGATVYSDPGDGSLMEAGCPAGKRVLSFISGFDEGGLCCLDPVVDAGAAPSVDGGE